MSGANASPTGRSHQEMKEIAPALGKSSTKGGRALSPPLEEGWLRDSQQADAQTGWSKFAKSFGVLTTPAFGHPSSRGGDNARPHFVESSGKARTAKGAATIYFVLLTVVVLGLLVMAVDFGRLYLIQSELQTAADAAALAAASRLVGTANATLHANDQVTASFDTTTENDNRFNLRTNPIGGGGVGLTTTTEIEFYGALLDAQSSANGGLAGGIDWGSGSYPKYVRVHLGAEAPVVFAPFLTGALNALPIVNVSAVAGVSGPVCSAMGIDGVSVVDQSGGSDLLNYGFVPGGFYTLYLTPAQNSPNVGNIPAPQAGTLASVPYEILDHVPAGVAGLDLDGLLFQMGAGGISTARGLTPPGAITIDSVEAGYSNLAGNTTAGTTVGRDLLCGWNTRFGVDPLTNICGTLDNGQFATLAPSFSADTDVGAGEFAAGTGLQDFATEYDGNLRRILTTAVVDAVDSLTVLNFRQFLLEMAPAGVTEGLNPQLANGAFRVQYIGAPVPIRAGTVGGTCRVSAGVGRVVLH